MSTLRITAGDLRGRRIPVPQRDVRPTSERARQAFFNIVADRIVGARFLDLFAGSGIFSFEAVSRGAQAAIAIDIARANVAAIEKHAKALDANVIAIAGDVKVAIKRIGGSAIDVVYADPPYAYDDYDELLTALDAVPFAPEAVIAIEHRRNTEPFGDKPHRLQIARRAEYGEVWMTFFTAATG